jgi:hypothetical protein
MFDFIFRIIFTNYLIKLCCNTFFQYSFFWNDI